MLTRLAKRQKISLTAPMARNKRGYSSISRVDWNERSRLIQAGSGAADRESQYQRSAKIAQLESRLERAKHDLETFGSPFDCACVIGANGNLVTDTLKRIKRLETRIAQLRE